MFIRHFSTKAILLLSFISFSSFSTASESYSKWNNYHCDNNQSLKVRYIKSKNPSSVQVKFGKKMLTLQQDKVNSNSEQAVFSHNSYSWSVNTMNSKSIQTADTGFLTLNKKEWINGKQEDVSKILRKNCSIKK